MRFRDSAGMTMFSLLRGAGDGHFASVTRSIFSKFALWSFRTKNSALQNYYVRNLILKNPEIKLYLTLSQLIASRKNHHSRIFHFYHVCFSR